MEPCSWTTINEISGRMVFSIQNPFGGEQTFDADWSAGMNSSGGNANFSTQTESEAIGEPWAGIVEDAGAINLLLEVLGRVFYLKESNQ